MGIAVCFSSTVVVKFRGKQGYWKRLWILEARSTRGPLPFTNV